MKLSDVKSKCQQIFSNTMGKIVFVLTLPTMITLVFLLCNNLYHLNRYKTLIITNYSNELNTFLSDAEEKMNIVISSANFISINQDIDYMLTTDTKPPVEAVSPAISAIKKVENFSNLIDSIAVYNRSGRFVVTSFGLYDADIYFNNVNSYNKYPISYWSEYRTITGNIKALPPTTIENDTSEITKTIVPFVFTSIGNTNSNNIIIFNISVDTLFEYFETYKLTPNTKLYMIDNFTSDIYSGVISSDVENLNPQIVSSLQSSLRSNTDIIKINGEKHLSICSTERSNLWGYTYMVTVPYRDINRYVSKIIIAASLFMLALSFILLIYILFGTRVLYSPWQKLAATATKLHKSEQNNEKMSADIEGFLESSFLSMAAENESLEESLSVALPLGQEKYLIDILNDNCTDDESLMHLSFRYDYFASISVSMKINPVYIAKISEQDIAQINTALRKLIRGVFSDSFVTYELPGTNNILYLLLNLENDLCMAEIQKVIKKIKKILSADADNIEIIFCIGGIYQGLNGLKLTHQESISNLMKELTLPRIQFSSANKEYTFTANSEGVLINYLTAGYFDKAREFLENIYGNIAEISISARRQVYADIITALKKCIIQRGISFSTDAADYILDMLKTSNTLDDEKFQSYINDQLNIISDAMRTYCSKIDIAAVISYIDNHYTEDIGLEELAGLYGTSAKYLSKRIREYLDMPFKKYLTSLRISKAKELLETADITISELYTRVGFQNRSAFINAFKLSTGLAPSDYKKIYKKK